MAFKTVDEFNKERGYDNYFSLRNDGDAADVIILYRSTSDVLVADAHYIKSNDYTGYVHCCGRGCPACGKGISVRNKLFVPLYNLNNQRIEFWDRNMFFENQLQQDVFSKYPNPSDYVFRITRHGQARDVNTTYEIRAVAKNDTMPYDVILAKFNTKVPDVYNNVIREFSAGELNLMLSNASSDSSTAASTGADLPSYQVTPRAAYNPTANSVPAPVANPVDAIDVDYEHSDSYPELDDDGDPDF